MGIVLKEQGKMEEATDAYRKAIFIKPDFVSVFRNLGLALTEQGKIEEAKEEYKNALAIKPDYVEVFNSMGNALKDLGRIREAISAYKNVINLQPDYSQAHRSLCKLQRYNSFNAHYKQVKQLYNSHGLRDEAKCDLGFALAKIYEDTGKTKLAFDHFCDANALRKKN